jgi:hypothetical protein
MGDMEVSRLYITIPAMTAIEEIRDKLPIVDGVKLLTLVL